MTPILPPMRLTGALSLRDGRLQARSVGLAGGRFTTGPLPAVDLTGYYLLPGIVDLQATGFHHHLDGTQAGLSLIDREAASHGVTTRYLSQPWSWERPGMAPPAATDLLRSHADYRSSALIDLRMLVDCETLMAPTAEALLALVQACGVDFVLFSSRADYLRDLRRADPDAFAGWAWTHGTTAEALAGALDTVTARAEAIPRFLLRLSEEFDRLGITYGSCGDRAAEVREHFSMLGARLCLNPATPRVAAAARAVGDPVLASADAVLNPAVRPGGMRVVGLIQSGLCDGLVSGRQSAAPLSAVFRLADLGILPLERGWHLVSGGPAEILGLPDRGSIAPGKRADLTIVKADTRAVEATIAGGRLAYLAGEAAARFLGADRPLGLAAE